MQAIVMEVTMLNNYGVQSYLLSQTNHVCDTQIFTFGLV